MLSPVELEFELFCRGLRIDDSCALGEDGRHIARTRAGLGSGLELVIPGWRKRIWVNVPVVERFASLSPLWRKREAWSRRTSPPASMNGSSPRCGSSHALTSPGSGSREWRKQRAQHLRPSSNDPAVTYGVRIHA